MNEDFISDSVMTDSSFSKYRLTDDPEDEDWKKQGAFTKVYFEKPSELTDTLNLARTLFDLREFRKCANLLKPFANHKC